MTINKHDDFDLEPLVLASGSPRRSEILNAVGWEFDKQVPDIDESVLDEENAYDYVLRLAVSKASAMAAVNDGRIVLGADTTVVVDEEIVGKPIDLEDARAMISGLSGRKHKVLTGIALVRDSEIKSEVVETAVSFYEMDSTEVDFLAERGEPMDKAGAYAVQAQAALFIEGIRGDYWNVVGLPISRVYSLYREMKNGAK